MRHSQQHTQHQVEQPIASTAARQNSVLRGSPGTKTPAPMLMAGGLSATMCAAKAALTALAVASDWSESRGALLSAANILLLAQKSRANR
jgi:hypothetical protein